MIYYNWIYYRLLNFPFLPFKTIYYRFITSFITISNLGIFITIFSIYYQWFFSFITIYSIHSIYYQGNLEMSISKC